MIDILDGRGLHKKALSDENRIIVRLYFKWHPGATIGDACKGTGLTYKTVKRHILAIQAEEGKQ